MRRRLYASELSDVFDDIRAEEDLPIEFPPAVLAEAEAAAGEASLEDGDDLRHHPFVTIDPPEAMDLDQAMMFEALHGGGLRLRYAIADVAAFVAPSGSIDDEARRRGVTVYCPDRRVPLHPPVLSEGVASLLPGQDRAAIVWEVDVDADGNPTRHDVRRAVIRSRARFDYRSVQGRFDAGDPPPELVHLERFGTARIARGVERGAITLRLPEQETKQVDGVWRLVNSPDLPTERWNAEVSLLTGMLAADMMVGAGVGILRTLPQPSEEAIDTLRAATRSLGVDWSGDERAADVLAGLDPSRPRQMAVFEEATRLLRGAGYHAFVNGAPSGDSAHAGLATTYAHVTAPLRRLVDRFALETCLAVAADTEVPEWVLSDIEGIPQVMEETDRRANQVERRCVDSVEAAIMGRRIGHTFDAIVMSSDRGGVDIWIDEPPILARMEGPQGQVGSSLTLTVESADVLEGRIVLRRVEGS